MATLLNQHSAQLNKGLKVKLGKRSEVTESEVTESEFTESEVTESEVRKEILNLSSKKTTKNCDIPAKILNA